MAFFGKECFAVFLGPVEYMQALELQMRICAVKRQGFAADVLLLLEHPPTITLGRNSQRDHLLVSERALRARGIRCYEVDRGGDITYHGPGQLVGYPILQLELPERDVRRFMRNLEESLIRLLASYGITGTRKENLTGVWTEQGKIGAMGVHISRWITRHGFALNVNTDLASYDLIVPCGISGQGVASMHNMLCRSPSVQEAAQRYVTEFGSVMSRHMIEIAGEDLLMRLHRHAQKIEVA